MRKLRPRGRCESRAWECQGLWAHALSWALAAGVRLSLHWWLGAPQMHRTSAPRSRQSQLGAGVCAGGVGEDSGKQQSSNETLGNGPRRFRTAGGLETTHQPRPGQPIIRAQERGNAQRLCLTNPGAWAGRVPGASYSSASSLLSGLGFPGPGAETEWGLRAQAGVVQAGSLSLP